MHVHPVPSSTFVLTQTIVRKRNFFNEKYQTPDAIENLLCAVKARNEIIDRTELL